MKGKLLQTLLDKGGAGAAKAIMAFGSLEIAAGVLRKFDFISRADSKMLGGLAFLLTGYLIERGQKKSEVNRERIEEARDEVIVHAGDVAKNVAESTAKRVVRETNERGVQVFRGTEPGA
ncbi:MAG: hypothetical protein M3547_01410, partial [Acidobacteriota bacterium]|nr:hypothetical protein [Acidobacteriota bacterium]